MTIPDETSLSMVGLFCLAHSRPREHIPTSAMPHSPTSPTRPPNDRTSTHIPRDPPRDPDYTGVSHLHARIPALTRPSNRLNRLYALRAASARRPTLRIDPDRLPQTKPPPSRETYFVTRARKDCLKVMRKVAPTPHSPTAHLPSSRLPCVPSGKAISRRLRPAHSETIAIGGQHRPLRAR